jgi:hypothetical protein
MKYEVGSYVWVTLLGRIAEVDDSDEDLPYFVDYKPDIPSIWVGEENVQLINAPAFSIDSVINDGFGNSGQVVHINCVPQTQSYQYKVNGVWFNEQELLEKNQ